MDKEFSDKELKEENDESLSDDKKSKLNYKNVKNEIASKDSKDCFVNENQDSKQSKFFESDMKDILKLAIALFFSKVAWTAIKATDTALIFGTTVGEPHGLKA